MQEITHNRIQQLDKSDMLSKLTGFSEQVQKAWEIGIQAELSIQAKKVTNIVVSGMGGSAIGGDLLRNCLADEVALPILVNRYYFLPKFVNSQSLVFISSYSGETEESLSAYKDANNKGAQIVCISSGGTLSEWAKRDRHTLVKIPTNYPPRTALGFLTLPMVAILSRLKLVGDFSAKVRENVDILREDAERYHPNESTGNLAQELAGKLYQKIPLIYSSVQGYEAVALRWKGQMSENAKVLAFSNCFPELNHNEIVGWGLQRELQERLQVIYLRDRQDFVRVQRRMEITKEILAKETAPVLEVYAHGQSLLARMFSLICLGDFVSYYLAILNGVDPTPVEKIQFLKNRLKEDV